MPDTEIIDLMRTLQIDHEPYLDVGLSSQVYTSRILARTGLTEIRRSIRIIVESGRYTVFRGRRGQVVRCRAHRPSSAVVVAANGKGQFRF